MATFAGLRFVKEVERQPTCCSSGSCVADACSRQQPEVHVLDGGARTCLLLPASDHVHGPGCGHEAVPHLDHIDWLVGDELQHIGNTTGDCCCQYACLGDVAGAVVSHGRLSSLRNRHRSGSAGASTAQGTDAVELVPVLTTVSDSRSDIEMGGLTSGVGALETVVETRIYAGGICCPMEVPLINSVLESMSGVLQVEVAVMTQTVTVRHEPASASAAALVAALNAVALDASLSPPRAQPRGSAPWLPPTHLLVAAALLIVSLFQYLDGPTGHRWLEHLKWAAIASVAIGIPTILRRALGALTRLLLDINILMIIAVAGAIALEDYTEAAAVVVLFGGAEWLEVRATGRARDAITAILALKPSTAVLAANGETVPASEIGVGVAVIIAPGAQVPTDGVVTSGHSAANQAMITGEAAPVAKGPGDEVLGGTINAGDETLEVRTTAGAESSTVAELGRLVERAASQRSPLEGAVARFAKWYTPLVLVAAALIAFVPWATSSDHRRWVYLALQVLVVSCPCALVLSTPVAAVCAIAAAAKAGVLIRGGTALEALGRVKAVLLDKTGTLTEGRCEVVNWEECGGWPREAALALAAAAERGSSHPIAAAIAGAAAAAATGEGGAAPVAATTRTVAGQGVVAEVGGRQVVVGNSRLLRGEGVRLDPPQAHSEATWQAKGATAVWVAVDGHVAGLVVVSDKQRPGAAAVVAQLHALKVACVMATGDSAGAAHAVATAVGLPPAHVHAALLPADKLRQVRAYKDSTGAPVAMVGDGVNDAPALAAADVGIAMGARGAAAALEAAPVSMFGDDLDALPGVLRLGRATRRTILANIAASVSTKVAALVLAALGKFTLWGAVLVDVGTSLAVIANSLRLLRQRVRPDRAPRGGPEYTCARTPAAAAAAAAASGFAGHGKCCAGVGCSSGGVGTSSGGENRGGSSGSNPKTNDHVHGEECSSGKAGAGGASHTTGNGCGSGTCSSRGDQFADTPATDGAAQKLNSAHSAVTCCSADDGGCASLSKASPQASCSHSAPQIVPANSCCSSGKCSKKTGPAEHAAIALPQAPTTQVHRNTCCGRQMTTCSRRVCSEPSTEAATSPATATEHEHAGAAVSD